MQKLELTWIGKGKEPKIEPRILIHDKSRDYGDPNAKNMLIHGDNLLALKALEQDFAGQVKCIYIDPPFNTGARIDGNGKKLPYEDNLEHSIWLGLMYRRFKIFYNLLINSGVLFVNLDDSESAYAKVLLDEIFGRKNYLNEIIVATNKSFGFKSTSDGIFKQANHILLYAKDKSLFKINLHKMFIEKEYDEQYKWAFENCDLSENHWSWRNIKDIVAERLGFANAREAQKKNPKNFVEAMNIYALENADKVFRTASVTGGALAKRRDTILLSKQNKNKIIRHPNDDMNYMFIGGERVLFYKERLRELDGVWLPAEVITDIWNDISIEGLANEGGVDFPRGKKPEKLIQRCIDLTTQKGDIVLDSFLGSGTTAAVAHKMGRRYIGIEFGDHCYTHCLPRLKAVVDGEQGGISKSIEWKGGGGFKFYELAPTLIVKDKNGFEIISDQYDATMLAAAVSKLCGYRYAPREDNPYIHGENNVGGFIFVTTRYITASLLGGIAKHFSDTQPLLICASAFQTRIKNNFSNIKLRKIPQSVLAKCDYGADNYNLNIVELPDFEETAEDFEDVE
jgi:adenine-specific DNA-methyltransferase